MANDLASTAEAPPRPTRFGPRVALALLWRDKFALAAALFLLLVVFAAVAGQQLFESASNMINLRGRNAPPGLENGWAFILGGDSLGRPILLRLIVGARNTLLLSISAVIMSLVVGALLGFVAGYRNDWLSHVIMRGADILMSFPSLLLALIVLYVLQPNVTSVVMVLAVTRVPIFLRLVRAETLEVRERTYVVAARLMGASPRRLVWRHMRPAVAPTIMTVATMEVAFVMLAESSLSFLGLGIQPPEFTWGAMVAQGQSYLASAWWVAFWPGLAITLTALSLNLMANWLRMVVDPVQRWRLETPVVRNDG